LHEREQLARRTPTPGVDEFRTRELGRITLTLEIRLVTACALRLIGRPAGGRLRRGVPAGSGSLLASQQEAARRDGNQYQRKPRQ
jgi:hypothetical protein